MFKMSFYQTFNYHREMFIFELMDFGCEAVRCLVVGKRHLCLKYNITAIIFSLT